MSRGRAWLSEPENWRSSLRICVPRNTAHYRPRF